MQKLSKAEAGKLGAEKSKIICAAQKQERILLYNENPSKCQNCNESLEYSNRHNKFCSHSCSATVTNTNRRSLVKWNCLCCNQEHYASPHRIGTYCNLKCQQNHQYKSKIDNWLNHNENIGTGAIKRYITETFGNKCSCCGISDYNNKPIVFELEHIDGNSNNNRLENVCLLCPNCHSQTPTYKGRNKGNGRHTRRQRYAEGKSY